MADLKPWLKVKARYEAGESVPLHVRRMAESVLGERFVRGPRPSRGASRPDHLDRQAGDDSFDDGHDAGMVAL